MVNPNTTRTNSYQRAIGVFKRREDLEGALRALKDDNFDMNRVSLIARHMDEVKGAEDLKKTDRGDTEAQEGAGIGATTGTVLGGLGGLLVGLGVLAIPGVGPILAAGAEINALAATLAGAGIGAATGGIVGALVGLGIPEEDARAYNKRIEAGEYLLMVTGSPDEVRRAESILRDRHIDDFRTYDAPEGTVDRTTMTSPSRERIATSDVSREGEVTKTYDIDKDGRDEVIIVDKRDDVVR